MAWLSYALVFLVALMHFYFGILEMFLWTRPDVIRKFGMTPDKATVTKVMAANQGLYNFFLGTGLLYGIYSMAMSQNPDIAILHLGFVIVAGIYGGWSVGKKLFYIQSVPAIIALLVVALAWFS